jgi:5,10-methylene-tetrahydrofolate dehydrogenase/methenyl tetrahydrofolate cyclohydrolase
VCRDIRDGLRVEIDALKTQHPGFAPHLVIIQVGEREDSTVYVNMKKKAAEEVHPLSLLVLHAAVLLRNHNQKYDTS